MKYYKVTWVCNSGYGGEKHYIGMEVGLFFIDDTHRFFNLLKRCQKYETKYNEFFHNEYIRAICNCELLEITKDEYTLSTKLFIKPFYFSGTADRGGLFHSETTFDQVCQSIQEQIDEIKDEMQISKILINKISKKLSNNNSSTNYIPYEHIYFTPYEKYLLTRNGLQETYENHGYTSRQVIIKTRHPSE
ncbi:MAG: hypothetical protein WD512_10955 [Candidatus Paceibacterota bacterium]